MKIFKFVVPDLRLLVVLAPSEADARALAADYGLVRSLDVSWLDVAQVTTIDTVDAAVVAFVGGAK